MQHRFKELCTRKLTSQLELSDFQGDFVLKNIFDDLVKKGIGLGKSYRWIKNAHSRISPSDQFKLKDYFGLKSIEDLFEPDRLDKKIINKNKLVNH